MFLCHILYVCSHELTNKLKAEKANHMHATRKHTTDGSTTHASSHFIRTASGFSVTCHRTFDPHLPAVEGVSLSDPTRRLGVKGDLKGVLNPLDFLSKSVSSE